MGGTNTENTDDKGGKKPAFTDEQREELSSMVGGAVASHMKRGTFKEMLSGVVTEALGTALPDAIKAAIPKTDPANTEKEKEAAGKKGGALPPELQAQIDAITTENKKLHDRIKLQEAKEAERVKAETEAKQRGALEKSLVAAGVPAPVARAQALLIHTEHAAAKRIKTTDAGDVLMTKRTEYGDEDVAVDKWTADYMKTDEGKAFLPPVGASGAGSSGGGAGQIIQSRNGQPLSKSEKLKNLGTSLLRGDT